jgi:phenylalanyl-tRNA synthetase beta chain
VRKLSLPDLEDVAFVTTYRGKQLDKGQKSLTITLSFRSPTATLTSEQVETSVRRVADEAQKQLNATLRA